jgi:hypothetical protein
MLADVPRHCTYLLARALGAAGRWMPQTGARGLSAALLPSRRAPAAPVPDSRDDPFLSC